MSPGNLPDGTLVALQCLAGANGRAVLHVKHLDRAIRRAGGKLLAVEVELGIVLSAYTHYNVLVERVHRLGVCSHVCLRRHRGRGRCLRGRVTWL